MSLAQMISAYVTLNLLIITAFGVLWIWRQINIRQGRRPSAALELRMHYLALRAALIMPFAQGLLPGNSAFEPAVKIWSATSIKAFSNQYSAEGGSGYFQLPQLGTEAVLSTTHATTGLWGIAPLILAVGFLSMLKDVYALCRIRKHAHVIRQIGKVAILVHDDVNVPFSYWLPGIRGVVLPSALVANHSHYRTALLHELQHHRQGDPVWVHLVRSLRFVCFLNPVMLLWSRSLSEIQEFACDATLIDRRKVESLQYMRCLLEVAESTLNQQGNAVGAAATTLLVERKLLTRRMTEMLNQNVGAKRVFSSWLAGSLLIGFMAATAYASKGMVQDRRVSMNEAVAMASKSSKSAEFPIVVNEAVLTQLNRYLGTPEGRAFMRKSLARMKIYDHLVRKKIDEYRLPQELAAIPIVESGYKNLSDSEDPGHGAGIWMFLAQTARDYGLRVDSNVDERLNPELLSDAAMQYLKGGRLQFQDWHLAVLAYNIGPEKVQEGIDATHQRDAWNLIRSGYENDRDYLAKVMAAILIMKNPEVVD